MGNLTCYYAHPMSLYGTRQERRDIAVLESLGFDVINPNTPEHAAASKGIMEYYCQLAVTCDVCAFRALPDGSIGAGVAKEIDDCMESEIPVIELPSCINRRTLTIQQTVDYLHECGQR